MKPLTNKDKELIKIAKETIESNYDGKRFMHTVGAALLTEDDKIFKGVNVYSMHGACAEVIAIGCAITAGERNIKTIVAIKGDDGQILPPCGNCRQLMSDICPNVEVILRVNNEIGKVSLSDLLPYAYVVE